MKPDDASSPLSGRPTPRGDGDEVDPTGVRHLLRSLPDPGPLPEDLVLRIEAVLRQEQARRAATAVPGRPGTEPLRGVDRTVIDLSSERSRRRPVRTLSLVAGAAAGLLVAAVAVGNLLDSGVVGSADSAAYAPDTGDGQAGGSVDSGSDAGGAAEQQARDSAAGSAESGVLSAPQAQIQVLPDLGEVTADDFDEHVIARAGADQAMAETSRGLTAAQAKSCWETVRSDRGWWSRSVAPAHENGRDVVVLLALDPDRSGHAWLVPGDCVADPSTRPLADVAVTP